MFPSNQDVSDSLPQTYNVNKEVDMNEGKKKRKCEDVNNRPPPREGRCQYWLPKKQRYCNTIPDGLMLMCTIHAVEETQQRRSNATESEGGPSSIIGDTSTCSLKAQLNHLNHGPLEARIPCPINPNHTIKVSQLHRHLRVCPDKVWDPRGHPAFRQDINS
eukprot:Tbor_TRINITY_DN9174_c0_g1::TRINITY_DN9174_c0_g1_i1::g.14508::m.14508